MFSAHIRHKFNMVQVTGSRELASLPIRRPRRFWDFHIPMATWDYKGRISYPPQKNHPPNKCDTVAREWVSIPDANLPGPWTCDWASWPWWENATPLEATLAVRYAVSDAPLTPIVFNSFDGATLFACAATRRFFLYHSSCGRRRPDETMYAFEGVFPSVEAFIEEADWNRVEKVERACEADPATLPTARPGSTTLPLISGKGFRVAATEPYPRRTLWDMCPPPGTFMYQPRWHHEYQNLDLKLLRGARDWPRIPDTQLPEPWSCNWSELSDSYRWYDRDGEGPQEVIEESYGRALRGFVPALFHPLSPAVGLFREDVVLCPPGGAGTYYLWWNQELREPRPEIEEMQRFEGVYANVEHFVRTADWNRMEGVPLIPPDYSRDFSII